MSNQSIYFHSEEIGFRISSAENISDWIEKSILLENKELGVVNYIFCPDDYLLKINQDYLNHDTFTDVITFNYVEGDSISGDIFISIDRINDNAVQNKVEFESELHRVMIHGILHLIGYNDKTTEEAREIRDKEDFYLTLLAKN